jgi:hypothetical protein
MAARLPKESPTIRNGFDFRAMDACTMHDMVARERALRQRDGCKNLAKLKATPAPRSADPLDSA